MSTSFVSTQFRSLAGSLTGSLNSESSGAAISSSSPVSLGSFSYSRDFAGGVFEPDVIVPSQFIKKSGKELRGGERRLMAAILSDGIESYISHAAALARPLEAVGVSEKTGEATREALEWVNTKNYSYVFSFDNVCEGLGIDPDYLRLGLRRYLKAIRVARSQGQKPVKVWKKIRRPRK